MERKHQLDFSGTTSRTKQSFAQGTRVDAILKKYATQGISPNDVGLFRDHVNGHMTFGVQPDYDYQTQLNQVIEIQERFKRLPSALRARFRNDPGLMLRWITDPKNLEEATKLGLLTPPETKKEEPTAPPVTPAATPATDTKK